MTIDRKLFSALALCASALLASPSGLRAQETDVGPELGSGDVTGGLAERDNTRVGGVIYDSEGQPIAKVQVWVTNDRAPANRLRARSRPSGQYLVRDMGRLYTRDDVYGIVARVRFEADGFETFETKVPIEKNSYAEISPILWAPGTVPASPSWCLTLRGTISDAKGKGVRDAKVVVTSPDDPELRVETTTAKNGTYEALVWNAPAALAVEVSEGSATATEQITLAGEPRHDLVASVTQDFSLEP